MSISDSSSRINLKTEERVKKRSQPRKTRRVTEASSPLWGLVKGIKETSEKDQGDLNYNRKLNRATLSLESMENGEATLLVVFLHGCRVYGVTVLVKLSSLNIVVAFANDVLNCRRTMMYRSRIRRSQGCIHDPAD